MMSLASTTDILLAMLAVMALGALGGWFAGTGLYFLRRSKLSRRQKRDLSLHLIPGLASVTVFLVVLAPLFRELGGNVSVVLGFLAMMIVPFSILGAQTAWHGQSRRHHSREKIKTISKALALLRTQRHPGRK